MRYLNGFKTTLAADVTSTGETSWEIPDADAALLQALLPSAANPIRLQVRQSGAIEPAEADCEWVDVTATTAGDSPITVVRAVEGTAQTWVTGDELRAGPSAGWASAIGPAADPGGIRGLRLSRVYASPNWNLRVGPGAAFVPGIGRWVNNAADLDLAPSGLTGYSWYYVYLYEDANGEAAVEISATAPDEYYGHAAIKTGDDTRRFLGCVMPSSATSLFASHWYDAAADNRQAISYLADAASFLIAGTNASYPNPDSAGFNDIGARTPAGVHFIEADIHVQAYSSGSYLNRVYVGRSEAASNQLPFSTGHGTSTANATLSARIMLDGDTGIKYFCGEGAGHGRASLYLQRIVIAR